MLLFQKWYSPKNLKACPFTFPSSPEVYPTLSSSLTMSTPTSPSTFRSPQKAFHTLRSVTRTRPLYSFWQTMDKGISTSLIFPHVYSRVKSIFPYILYKTTYFKKKILLMSFLIRFYRNCVL